MRFYLRGESCYHSPKTIARNLSTTPRWHSRRREVLELLRNPVGSQRHPRHAHFFLTTFFSGRGCSTSVRLDSPSSCPGSPPFGGACLSWSIPRVPGTGFSCPVMRMSIISLMKAGSCLGVFPPVRCTHLATEGTPSRLTTKSMYQPGG